MCNRNINGLPLTHAPTGVLAHNPGMCPDWELNQQPFALGDNTQPTDPHWSGPFKKKFFFLIFNKLSNGINMYPITLEFLHYYFILCSHIFLDNKITDFIFKIFKLFFYFVEHPN